MRNGQRFSTRWRITPFSSLSMRGSMSGRGTKMSGQDPASSSDPEPAPSREVMRSTITLVWNQMRHHDRRLGIVTASRLLVTYLDRDMEFVWTPKHLDKMSWHRSSSVQIKPLQPTNSFFSANPATIRIDSLDFQSGRTI